MTTVETPWRAYEEGFERDEEGARTEGLILETTVNGPASRFDGANIDLPRANPYILNPHKNTTHPGQFQVRPFEPPSWMTGPQRPSFDPWYQPRELHRPIGYEDRRRDPRSSQQGGHRARSASDARSKYHPQRYTTDWNTFVASTPLSNPVTGGQFNIRVSNIDRQLSNEEIEAFFKARCGHFDGFRMEAEGRSKVAYLAMNTETGKQQAIALHGFRLGRYRVKIEWWSKG